MDLQEGVKNSQQWKDCLHYISRRVKEQSFNTWLKPIQGEANGDGQFKLTVPNKFVADWIEEHFSGLIDEAFSEVLGRQYGVKYIITEDDTIDTKSNQTSFDFNRTQAPSIIHRESNYNHNLNRKYGFDSLVVGDFNQFSCAAAMAVAEAPGLTKYNPLLIYGGTGLGKTHIVQAIGNSIIDGFPSRRVMYATSEKFTSDFIASISDHSISAFTKAYRDVDILIIDDIQFFTKKESTQEQFFHTFNTLHHQGKQIVLSSDRPPREIKGLEERLLSRFSWGLVTDLQAPDMENRTAILYKKLESEGVKLPENVLHYIADKVSTNIRELEGALIRLLAYASMKNEAIDLELTGKVLSGTLTNNRKVVDIDSIQRESAKNFNIDSELLKAKKKTSEVVLARHVAMYLSRSLTKSSLKAIGEAFGGRDHSTVIHACDIISRKMSTNPALREDIDKISASLLY
ncbi:MAG: chromosomal replication initiator protein DnaA [candidate division Zixibacteria bacterium]|nr:chromosomal replication initiator protein DnaA [candidate division Zixibacteria bacterium]